MGTRALVHVKAARKTLVTVYRQLDGYPTGLGAKLAEFLTGADGAPRRIVNGYSDVDREARAFNGAGCLAAQMVAALKQGIGDVYIEPPNASDVGEEYTYTLTVNAAGKLAVGVVAAHHAGDAARNFAGDAAGFLAWIADLVQQEKRGRVMRTPTRADYMAGRVDFATFYRAVNATAGIKMDSHPILARAAHALGAGDEHLNRIPLSAWDAIAAGFWRSAERALREHGDHLSLAGGVCLAKQAVRDALERGAPWCFAGGGEGDSQRAGWYAGIPGRRCIGPYDTAEAARAAWEGGAS